MKRNKTPFFSGVLCITFLFLSASLLHADMDWNVLDLSAPKKQKIVRTQPCKECHYKIYNSVLSLPGKHSIIVLRECRKCHLADRTRKTGYRTLDALQWREIELKDFSKEHMARLRNLSNSKKYFIQVDIKDETGKVQSSKKKLFEPGAISEFWVDDNKAPIIKSVSVDSVQVSVLPSAEIVVESDKMVKLTVKYGPSKKYGLISNSDIFKKKHRVGLNGLYSQKQYQFKVVATDPFGNSTESENFSFSTRTSKKRRAEKKKALSEVGLILFPLKIVRLVKSTSDGGTRDKNAALKSKKVAVFINSNKDVTASIRFREADEESLQGSKDLKHGEWGLKSRRQTGIDACIECHFQGASHPVGMRAKRKTIIPKELPTTEDGEMTCATCHEPHGSKFSFLARVDFSKQLCTMCHKGNFL
ncbi:MAG: cytochrome c3 family protein [Nitrospinota bacterium]